MLKYMENSEAEKVTNNKIASIHEYDPAVRRGQEAGMQYMESWEHECRIREEGRKEGEQQ